MEPSRNAPCFCGSGKRFKHCHGALMLPENVVPRAPFINAAVTKAKPKVFDPPGFCVYCGNHDPPLTTEHIVAKGLGGGLILRDACCITCQKIINEVETYCLRGLLLSHRLNIGLVQHRDDFRDELPFRFKVGQHEEVRQIPFENYPNYLALPQIHGGPGMLSSAAPGELFKVSFNLWGIEEELRALNETGNAMLVHDFDMSKFARMLGKIAHALAAAEIGVAHFDAALPNLILGRAPELCSFLVGAWMEPEQEPQNVPLHQVSLKMEPWGKRWLVSARIRLFANQPNAPAYKVIIGELIESPQLLVRFGLWSLMSSHEII